jgi:hypothetical protein
LQPPQAPVCMPKCGQAGRTRWDDPRWIAITTAFSKLLFFAVDVGRHLLKRQGALDEHHLAVGPVGNALGFDVERLDLKYIGRVVRAAPGFCGGFLLS